MNKKLIRLTESDLHRIVKESVNKVLKEDAPAKWHDGTPFDGKIGQEVRIYQTNCTVRGTITKIYPSAQAVRIDHNFEEQYTC